MLYNYKPPFFEKIIYKQANNSFKLYLFYQRTIQNSENIKLSGTKRIL